jgi:hypothetical protein
VSPPWCSEPSSEISRGTGSRPAWDGVAPAPVPAWLQLWLQLAAFTAIRSRARPYFSAGQSASGTVTNRHERDHDGLAVRGHRECAARKLLHDAACGLWSLTRFPGHLI